jgi:REP element-mobilizing transposase RayT
MKTSGVYQFTSSTLHLEPAFADRVSYQWLWEKLRRSFPKVLACALMPNHLHLMVASSDAVATSGRISSLLRAFTRRFHPGKPLWRKVPTPKPIPNEFHLRRDVRYIHLNPCREGLAKDPATWEWSTHRDLIGSVHPTWLDTATLARVFGCAPGKLAEEAHRYISSDPSVATQGTPLPRRIRAPLVVPMPRLLEAVLAAAREPALVQRRGGRNVRKITAHLAKRIGLASPEALGTLIGVHPRTAKRLVATPLNPLEEATLQAANLNLSDPRLQKG